MTAASLPLLWANTDVDMLMAATMSGRSHNLKSEYYPLSSLPMGSHRYDPRRNGSPLGGKDPFSKNHPLRVDCDRLNLLKAVNPRMAKMKSLFQRNSVRRHPHL